LLKDNTNNLQGNVMLSTHGHAVIIDLGMTYSVDDPQAHVWGGTIAYMAPEVWLSFLSIIMGHSFF
jgi:serine/threonine protein kinase